MEHLLAISTVLVGAWVVGATALAVLVGRACSIREREGH
jgi:hypothetical protein